MDSVGSDDQVEATGRGPLKLDVDSTAVLVQGGDRVVPDDEAVLPGLLEQQADEFIARDLDLLVAVDALARADRGLWAPVGVDEDQAFDTGGCLLQARPDTHLPCNSDRSSAYVDRVATRSCVGRSFHNRDRPTGPRQPVRDGRAGNAAAGDQYASIHHAPIQALNTRGKSASLGIPQRLALSGTRSGIPPAGAGQTPYICVDGRRSLYGFTFMRPDRKGACRA